MEKHNLDGNMTRDLSQLVYILKQEFKDMEYHIISSVSTFGINELKEDLWNKLNQIVISRSTLYSIELSYSKVNNKDSLLL